MEILNLLAIAFLIWLISLLVVRKLAFSAHSKLNLPPSPTALPIIGHLHLLHPVPHLAFQKLSTRLGPIVHLWLGSVPCVVASDADAAKEFLKANELCFSDRPRTKAINCLYYGIDGFIFAPYGDLWRFMKKLCVTELLGGRTLERLQWIRRAEIRRFFRTLHEKAEKRQEVDVGEELTRLMSDVIFQMVLSKRCSGTDAGDAFDVKKLMDDTSEVTGKFNLADFVGFCSNLDLQGVQKRAEDLQRRFDWIMEGILKEREDFRRKETTCARDDASTRDLLDMLLDISEDKAADIGLKREDIKNFVRDIFVASTDTTIITLEWALSELINHPAILQRAREEIDSVVGQYSRVVDESDIASLPFLQAIIKETLRLHPAAPLIFRQCTRHCKVRGYDILPNTRLFVNVWAIGRDPKQWEDPLEFRPERFMESGGSDAGVDLRGNHFQLLPFGSGRRVCPGISLALQVMLATLGPMIQCFEWGVEKGVVDMAVGQGLTLNRAHPLVCRPTARPSLPLP